MLLCLKYLEAFKDDSGRTGVVWPMLQIVKEHGLHWKSAHKVFVENICVLMMSNFCALMCLRGFL